jgi:hypothetical protein
MRPDLSLQVSWGQDGKCIRVGQNRQTNVRCGQRLGVKACLNVEKHDHCSFDEHGALLNHKGNGYFRNIFNYCDSPECCECFKSGFAVREARKIEERILAHQRKLPMFGLAEHVVLSVPKSDYGLSFEELKAKALKNLRELGVVGGVLLFHMERYHNRVEALEKNAPMFWHVSLHFHAICFIDGGFSCRGCHKSRSECLGCTGFNGRARRMYYDSNSSGFGWITKVAERKVNGRYVAGKRQTVFGTAYYQLSHATLVRGPKRNHVVWWFGTASYVQLKLENIDRIKRDTCPICGSELVEVIYVGSDPCGSVFQWWVKEWEEPFLDKNGSPNWAVKPDNLRSQ